MKTDIITIDDLSNEQIEDIFDIADEFLKLSENSDRPYAVQGRLNTAKDFILSTLFHEPSTRTRLSFESAMLRLGGHILSANDPSQTSAAKGETLADTVRVLENYSDIIVIRHPSEGAARVAASYAKVPVINAGDGGHEHPTQTLCDLYTLRREKKSLNGLTVLLFGDLKNGRTVHSLVFALARFGAKIVTLPSSGLELPPHVKKRLQTDYNCVPADVDLEEGQVGAIYQSPTRAHQLSLLPVDQLKLIIKLPHVDVCYVTRLQRERLNDGEEINDYNVINQNFLKSKKYRKTSVLHPLPRREELGYDLDADPRGVYFKQAAYGVPVRMALIAVLLGLRPLKRASPKHERHTYDLCVTQKGGVACMNSRCITAVENERKYLPMKFWITSLKPFTLRCFYCEHELSPQVIGDVKVKKYYTDISAWDLIADDNLIIFMDEHRAEEAGYVKGFKKRKGHHIQHKTPESNAEVLIEK